MENFFSQNIKHLRNKHNLTQLQLAKKLNKDYSTVGKWELGQRSPIMSDVIKIADLFDVSVDNLIFTDLRTNSSDEDKLNTAIRTLSEDDKKVVMRVVKGLKGEDNEKSD